MSTPSERLQALRALRCSIEPQQANASPNQMRLSEDTWRSDFALEEASAIPDRAEGTSADTWTRDALEANSAMLIPGSSSKSCNVGTTSVSVARSLNGSSRFRVR